MIEKKNNALLLTNDTFLLMTFSYQKHSSPINFLPIKFTGNVLENIYRKCLTNGVFFFFFFFHIRNDYKNQFPSLIERDLKSQFENILYIRKIDFHFHTKIKTQESDLHTSQQSIKSFR